MASHPFSPFTDESPPSGSGVEPIAPRQSSIHPRTLREKQTSQQHSRIASASTADSEDEEKAVSPLLTIASPSSSVAAIASPLAAPASTRNSQVLLPQQFSRSRRGSPQLSAAPLASPSMEAAQLLDASQPAVRLPPPLIIRDSPINAAPTTAPSSRPIHSPPSIGTSVSPRARPPALGPLQSPHNSEDEVNWTRRMQKVETTSSKRSSFIQRQAAGTPTPGLVRAHSFSAQTVMAAAAAASAFSPSGFNSHASSPKGSTVKKPPRAHHRSMSNVVDWTPYSKRKNRPIAVAPFSQRHLATPASHAVDTPASKAATMSMAGVPVVGSAAKATMEEEMETDAAVSWAEQLQHGLYLLRASRAGSRVRVLMHSLPYLTLIGVTTLFSLYAQDFNICWFPPSADTAISVLLTLALALFSLDIAVNCLLLPGYCLSFFCLVDVIGTVSLMLDIQFMLPLTLNDQNRSTNLQHLTQSGNVLRVTRFVRLFRIMQATRIVRLFKGETAAGKGEDRDAHANRVGMQLSELIDKRVISMLLGVIIILPFFTVDDTSYGMSQRLGLGVLESMLFAPSQPAVNSTLDTAEFLAAYELYNSNLLYLSFPTSPRAYTPVDVLAQQSGLRAHDLDVFTAPQGSTAVFNIESQYFQSSLFTIILTSIIIAMFVLGSLLVSRDVHSLVVAPLERMTSIIKKLAGTICFLTNDQDEPSRTRGHGRSVSSISNSSASSQLDTAFSAAANETRVIEGIIEKLATIFQVEPDASMSGPKALQRMAGSKHTEITTSTSVVSIAVVERPRMDVDAMADVGDVGGGSGGFSEREVDTERHRELRTVEDGIASAAVLPHFRLYLTTNLLMENLLFYQEVERYKAILLSHSHSLYANFISSSSSSQVNISAALHDSIRDSARQPRASMFDEAQHECVMLMKAHVRGFVDSRYCQLYLRKKGRAGTATGEVMYRKKRAAGVGTGNWTGGADSASGSGSSSAAVTTINTTRSTRGSIVMHRDMKIEEETEGDEQQQTAAAAVAVVQPKSKRHSMNAIAPAPPVVAVKAVKSKAGKSRAAKVSAMREEDLLAEIEALEHPGAEAAALFAPGKKKAKQAVMELSSAATAAVHSPEEELKRTEEQKQHTEADVAAEQKGVEERMEVESEPKQEAGQQSEAGGVGQAEAVSSVAAEAVETDAAGGVVAKAASSEDKVDADVEEEVARLLSADGTPPRSATP